MEVLVKITKRMIKKMKMSRPPLIIALTSMIPKRGLNLERLVRFQNESIQLFQYVILPKVPI